MSTIDLNYLYHGLVDTDLLEILDRGISPPSHWFLYDMADFWAWVRHYRDGGRPVVLRIPLDRFDPTLLKPDETVCDHPLMAAFEASEKDIESRRDRARQIARDSLNLCGGVRYDGLVVVATADVMFIDDDD